MADDEDLAERVRALRGDESGVSEQAMFGGLAFLLDGNVAVHISGRGGVLVRVDPAEADRLVSSTRAAVAVMGRRAMPGWLQVDPEHLETEQQLAARVRTGVDYARSLPAPRRRCPPRAEPSG